MEGTEQEALPQPQQQPEEEYCPIGENGLLKPNFATDDMDYYMFYNNDGLAGLYVADS